MSATAGSMRTFFTVRAPTRALRSTFFTSRQTIRRPAGYFSTSANHFFSARRSPLSRTFPQSFLQSLRAGFHTSRPRLSQSLGSEAGKAAAKENLSLAQRMKKLSREYGWSALGVYLALSALDFPFCYLLVRTLGTDRIGVWEDIVVTNVSQIIPESVKATYHKYAAVFKKSKEEIKEEASGEAAKEGWGVEAAQVQNKKNASLATQLALAYAIHKSFIFIRVPLTAALTPKIVKVLRGWGWDIGKRTTKAAKQAKIAEIASNK